MTSFREWFQEQPVVLFDGAMGTEIYRRGIAKGHCYDELNVSMPEIVLDIHNRYLAAGARVLTTNTFGANRFILEEFFGLGDATEEINFRGAQLARRAARGKAFVAGSVGPVSRPLDRESARRVAPEEAAELFAEQVAALLEGGVDLILFETFSCLEELLVAVEAARSVDPEVFVIAEAAFAEDGLTLFGKNPYEVAAALDRAGVDVLGTNCGTGPQQQVVETVRKMAQVTERPLSAMPNAGRARFSEGRFVYPENADYFARYALKAARAGAKVLGGCCGTGPQHVEAMAKALEGFSPRPRKRVAVEAAGAEERHRPERRPTGFERRLGEGFALALELDPPKGGSAERLLERAAGVAEYVDAFCVSDSPMARPRMSPVAVGTLVQDRLGVEVVVHYTCRDRNVLGMHGDLLGAWALGLKNVLALGGDPPSVGDYPFATGVYDVTSEGLVALLDALNRGENLLGAPLGEATGFFIGVAASAGAGGDAELARLEAKVAKGAHFVMTQPVFDPTSALPFFKRVKALGVKLVAGIMPMVSGRNAEYLHYEVPGIEIPERYLERMAGKSGPEGRREGVAIAVEVISELAGEVDGILVMPPTGRLDAVAAIAKALRDRGIWKPGAARAGCRDTGGSD